MYSKVCTLFFYSFVKRSGFHETLLTSCDSSQRMYARLDFAFSWHIWRWVQIDRTKRIRDAKAEAQKEIDEYRQQKEEEFKKFEAEVSLGFGDGF